MFLQLVQRFVEKNKTKLYFDYHIKNLCFESNLETLNISPIAYRLSPIAHTFNYCKMISNLLVNLLGDLSSLVIFFIMSSSISLPPDRIDRSLEDISSQVSFYLIMLML